MLLAALVAAPLVWMYAHAIADGAARHREIPLVHLFGKPAYERLASRAKTEEHYWGEEFLAPDFVLKDHLGRPWRLKDHRGKVIVMNFWTMTCRPCIDEMPSLEELARIVQHESGIEVVAISTDASWDAVRMLFPPHPNLKILFDPEKKIVLGKYGTRMYPETWIIDPSGVIRLRVDGPRDWSSAVVLEAIRGFRGGP